MGAGWPSQSFSSQTGDSPFLGADSRIDPRENRLILLDSAGAMLASYTGLGVGVSTFADGQLLEDGSLLITGCYDPDGSGAHDVLLMKVGSSGVVQWQRQYGGDSEDEGNRIKKTADGHYIIVGTTLSFGAGSSHGYLIKVNSDGDSLWTRTIGESGTNSFRDVACLPDGSIVAVGWTSTSEWAIHPCAVKVDANGRRIWTRILEAGDYCSAYGIVAAQRGGFAVVGSIDTLSASDGYLWRLDDEGLPLWQCAYRMNNIEWFESIIETTDSCFVIGGSTYHTHNEISSDFWLVKTGPDPVLAVEAPGAPLPNSYAMEVYPNPFNATTSIAMELPQGSEVKLEIVDILGRAVQTLTYPHLSAGRHVTRIDASWLPSGSYFARVTAGEFSKTEKLVLVK